MSSSLLFVLVSWISVMPCPCYPALAEGEFGKYSLCPSTRLIIKAISQVQLKDRFNFYLVKGLYSKVTIPQLFIFEMIELKTCGITMSSSVLFILVSWISMMPCPCCPALAEGEFGKLFFISSEFSVATTRYVRGKQNSRKL